MFKKSKKVLVAALILVLALGLAVYAKPQLSSSNGQGQQQVTGNQGPGAAGQQRNLNRGQGANPQGLGGGNQGGEHQNFLRLASLQRILLPPMPRELERMSLVLNLTEEQKQQVKTLYQQFFNTVKPIGQTRGTAVKNVLDTLQGASPTKGALQSAANQVFQADNAIVDAEFDFWLGLKTILNSQQQQSLGQYIQQKALMEIGGPRLGPGGPKAPGAAPQQ